MLNNTAILIFTRNASQEARCKSLVATKSNQQVMAAMIQHTRKVANSCSFDVFETSKQEGNTFGERLANAMYNLFQKGYNQLIVIGNDTPHLHKKHIEKAYQLLKSQRVVVGPSVDGGIYLLGIQKQAFQAQAFAKLAWQTSMLYTSLQQYISSQQQQLICLEQLHDVDDAHSLNLVLTALKHTNIVLYSVLYRYTQVYSFVFSSYSLNYHLDYYASNRSLRAPPTL